MNLITKWGNWWWLIRYNKKPIKWVKDEYKAKAFIKNTIRIAKEYKKGGWFRNSIAWHVKDMRNIYPYKVIDYSEAKEMYEDYFKRPNHIPSFDVLRECIYNLGAIDRYMYITCFRDEVPVRGDKFNDYYINRSYGSTGIILQMRYYNKKIQSRTVQSKWRDWSPWNEDAFTNWLFATKEQITAFLEAERQYEFLSGEREKVLEELKRIDNEIAKVK